MTIDVIGRVLEALVPFFRVFFGVVAAVVLVQWFMLRDERLKLRKEIERLHRILERRGILW